MKPPYDITTQMLRLIAAISEKIGELRSGFMDRPSPQLRKQNKIKTIHHSLKIEGNTLSEAQITELIENKRVLGPAKDIREVLNAIKIYENLRAYNPASEKSFLKAHQILMQGLIEDAGRYRTQGVGIVKGNKVEHLAPPHQNVPYLVKELLRYVKNFDELPLIKSCVFHYEMEFIHPFVDGNGRMGRLWQTLILYQAHPVFEYLPFESLISETQQDYYSVLSECDKAGKSTLFIEYMLSVIDASMGKLLNFTNQSLSQSDRLNYFIAQHSGEFSRKNYMNVFKHISPATASRDLKFGIEKKLFESIGAQNQTRYRIKP